MKLNKNQLPALILLFSAIILLIVTTNIHWGKERWRQVIVSDAEGYYAWLPAIFIHHDLNFTFFDTLERGKYYDPDNDYDYRVPVNGATIDKYYCGTALLQLPFFAGAHLWAMSGGYDMDGYSRPYPLMMCLAAVFWLLFGLWFLNRLLKIYGFSPLNRSITLAGCVFATHLFYYTIGEPGMSHVFSFAAVSFFLFCSASFFRLPSRCTALGMFAALAVIILIRPVNGLVICSLPFLAGNRTQFRVGLIWFFKQGGWLLFPLLIFGGLLSIQLVLNRISTGSFFIYSYLNEGFDFTRFNFVYFLLSYKKGFFVYTPLAALALPGFWFLFKRSRFSALMLLSFLLLLVYVLSSWWNWWYGGSFSSRVMAEYLPFLMILLAFCLEDLKKRWARGIYISLIVLCTLVCQVQTYQYRYHRIHWEDMNRESYWKVFMRIDQI